jgi:hypothetical protein
MIEHNYAHIRHIIESRQCKTPSEANVVEKPVQETKPPIDSPISLNGVIFQVKLTTCNRSKFLVPEFYVHNDCQF